MGWWQDRYEGKKVDMGDESIDLIHELLRAFAGPYQSDLGRKPLTQEFLASLSGALQTTGRDLFGDLEDREVVSVRLTTRKAPKTQKYAIGDYFVVPLATKEFAYGRIIGHDAAGDVIEVYRDKTKTPWSFPQLQRRPQAILLQTHVHGLLAFRARRWPILGHAPLAKDHPMPAFRLGDWQINQGTQTRTASTKEVLRMEPCVCWNPETVEARITSDHPEVWPELEEWQCRDFGDAYLKILHDPTSLRALYLSFGEVTDAGLKHLERCSQLKTLHLLRQPISDAGLKHLAALTALEELDLSRTRVTDAGLAHLRGLKNLRKLRVVNTAVTDQGIVRLKKALPKVTVEKEPAKP
jgi:hypothetical protein